MSQPRAYYNEHDAYAAQWIRALIAAGELPDGDVDERSILDVAPGDLAGYTQCHFFAGIGGWAYALRLAGWPDDRPVWTGSCPCQPFSAAGKGAGFADERHLWPAWHWLIAQCRPDVLFGEQVDKATAWLDLVCTDLEAEGYAVGSVDLPAGSVGAFHRRQRIYFVADTGGERCRGQHTLLQFGRSYEDRAEAAGGGTSHQLADPECHPGGPGRVAGESGESLGAPGAGPSTESGRRGDARELGNLDDPRSQRRRLRRSTRRRDRPDQRAAGSAGPDGDLPSPRRHLALSDGGQPGDGGLQRSGGHLQRAEDTPARAASPWTDPVWLACLDGKARPTQPGLFPLAHGVPARVGRLRGYGNAIVPQVAAAVIRAYLDVESRELE